MQEVDRQHISASARGGLAFWARAPHMSSRYVLIRTHPPTGGGPPEFRPIDRKRALSSIASDDGLSAPLRPLPHASAEVSDS
jgi:hypothetical protein